MARVWTEAAETVTHVSNSHGYSITFMDNNLYLGWEFWGRERASPRGSGIGGMTRVVRVDQLDAISPEPLLAELRDWELQQGEVDEVDSRQALVLLEPRASASWLRWLVPLLVRPLPGMGGPPWPSIDLEGFHIVDDPCSRGSSAVGVHDGEGRFARTRWLVRDGRLASSICDSRDPEASVEALGPMRRDSYRDPPAPGALRPLLSPGRMAEQDLLPLVGDGVVLNSLWPLTPPGAERLLAVATGFSVKRGRPARPIPRSLFEVRSEQLISCLIDRGSRLVLDDAGMEVGAPALAMVGVGLRPL
jgi:predicted Zn-dependent protease